MESKRAVLIKLGRVYPRNPVNSSTYAQNSVQAQLDNLVCREEEQSGECRHNKHHDRGDCCFTTVRPNHLADFGAGLLNELHWIKACHVHSCYLIKCVIQRHVWDIKPLSNNIHVLTRLGNNTLDYDMRLIALSLPVIAALLAPAPVMAQNEIKMEVARQFILAAPNSDSFLAMEKYFPKDAKKFVKTLARTNKRTSAKTIARRFHSLSARIRKKNARLMWSAPASNLLEVTAFYRDSLNYLKRDTTACNSFYIGGINALDAKTRARFINSKVGQQRLSGLKALAAGRDTPVRRGKARDADYESFAYAMVDAGMDEQDFNNIENPKVTNPKLCKSAIKMMDTLYRSDIDSIHRIRASVFYAAMAE